MTPMRYAQPPAARAADVRAALAERRPSSEVAELLVGAAFGDPDGAAVQDVCLDLLSGADRGLAAVAATCLGHLARIHRRLDVDRVVPALIGARGDPVVSGPVEDALDDLATYLGVRVEPPR